MYATSIYIPKLEPSAKCVSCDFKALLKFSVEIKDYV